MQRFHLYPINWVSDADGIEPNRFDPGILPFDVAEGVRIEQIEFKPGLFDIYKPRLGNDIIEKLENVHWAFVHRYDDAAPGANGEWVDSQTYNVRSEHLVRGIVACQRLIRPMRQRVLMIQGQIDQNGDFDHVGFDTPPHWMVEVPAAQKLWMLRTCDCHALREHVPRFLQAWTDEIWKFKMAVQFHEMGYFHSNPEDWKARLMMWASAIESIYTSHSRGHKGSLVATERIKWFLGENTNIYKLGDLTEFEEHIVITVGQIVNAIYNTRNFVAHGDRVPDFYMLSTVRNGFGGTGSYIDVLLEAMSFIVRESLLKILRDGLLEHFRGADQAETYFSSHHLTDRELRGRIRP